MQTVLLAALASLWLAVVADQNIVQGSDLPAAGLQEQSDGLTRNVEDMVAHGGMGDAKAIVHHCGEATRYAEAMIKHLSKSNSHQDDAVGSLQEVIKQCRHVSDIGIHADPGQLLNPATKARAAAQESIKSLGLTKSKKS